MVLQYDGLLLLTYAATSSRRSYGTEKESITPNVKRLLYCCLHSCPSKFFLAARAFSLATKMPRLLVNIAHFCSCSSYSARDKVALHHPQETLPIGRELHKIMVVNTLQKATYHLLPPLARSPHDPQLIPTLAHLV